MIRSPLFQKSQSMSSRLKRYSKVVAHGLVHSAARAMLGLAELQTALAPRATDCERTAKARGVIFRFRRHSSNRSSISGSYPLAGIDSCLQLAPARSNSESSSDTCSGVSTADCSCLGTMLSAAWDTELRKSLLPRPEASAELTWSKRPQTLVPYRRPPSPLRPETEQKNFVVSLT